jgi:hypothetical protein
MGHHRVAHEEDALEIDVAHAIKREFVSFANARRIKDASTVDEDIDASERSDNLRNKTLDFVNQCDVAREATGSATVCGNGINNLLRLPAIGAGYDSDAGALGGETPADGLPDALRAARDQDDLADESHANLFLVIKLVACCGRWSNSDLHCQFTMHRIAVLLACSARCGMLVTRSVSDVWRAAVEWLMRPFVVVMISANISLGDKLPTHREKVA